MEPLFSLEELRVKNWYTCLLQQRLRIQVRANYVLTLYQYANQPTPNRQDINSIITMPGITSMMEELIEPSEKQTDMISNTPRRSLGVGCERSQRMGGLCQRPQPIVEADRPCKKKRIVCECPPYAKMTWSCVDARVIFVFFHLRKGNAHGNPGFNPSPQPRNAAPVTESVRQDDSQEGPGPQIHKGSVPTKHGGVGELEYRSEQCSNERDVRVRYAELIEMMHMSDSEIERCDENYMAWGDLGEQVQWDNDGSKDDLLGDRALLL